MFRAFPMISPVSVLTPRPKVAAPLNGMRPVCAMTCLLDLVEGSSTIGPDRAAIDGCTIRADRIPCNVHAEGNLVGFEPFSPIIARIVEMHRHLHVGSGVERDDIVA